MPKITRSARTRKPPPRRRTASAPRSQPQAGGAPTRLRVSNAYEAAGQGRRLRGWTPGSPGPNRAVILDLAILRSRARELCRNNPWISRGIESYVSNEIGCGITMKSAAPDEEFRKRADDLWERQSAYYDADGIFDINGMMATIVRTRRAAGEIFIRRRLRDKSYGLPVPVQYQLLEPEHCPETYTDQSKRIFAGIEFNGIGKRTAYWMYRSHPGDGWFTNGASQDLIPVPAASVLHHYVAQRPGQIRGVPAIVQAMIRAKDFDEYDDAELVRKKTRAAFTGAITSPPKDEPQYKLDPLTNQPVELDNSDVPMTAIEPGTLVSLLSGEEVTMFEGDKSGDGYADFIRQQLLGIGAGQDVPYEFISGDFSKLNDRTLRVVLAEYHRTIERDRWQYTIPQVCYPIWQDFIDFAVISGALKAPADYQAKRDEYVKVTCHPEGWPYLHELQDANAAVIRLKAGLTSRKRQLSEQGIDVREVDIERAEDAARSAELGLSEDFTGDSAAPAKDDPEPDKDEPNSAQNLARDFTARVDGINAAIAALASAKPPDINVNVESPTVNVQPPNVTVEGAKHDIVVNPERKILGVKKTVTRHDAQGRILEVEERPIVDD